MYCRLLTQYAIIMVQFLAGLRKIKLRPGLVLDYLSLSNYTFKIVITVSM